MMMHWHKMKDTLVRLDKLRFAEWQGKVIRLVFLDGKEELVEFSDSKYACEAFHHGGLTMAAFAAQQQEESRPIVLGGQQ